ALKALLGAAAVLKDVEVSAPRPVNLAAAKGGPQPVADALNLEADSVDAIQTAVSADGAIEPNAYIYNNAIANVSAQHAAGFAGQGMTVAVIDSGIRPGFPHITLDGSVVGCE